MSRGSPTRREPPVEGSRSLRLGYPGVQVLVTGAERHLDWLEEFMCPDFVPGPPGPAGHAVRLEIDSARYLELRRAGPDAGGAQLDCFALESSTVRLPLWRSASDALTLFDAEYRVFYVVSADRREIRLIAPRFGLSVRNSLMRVVRELGMIGTERAGGLVLHGAAVLLGGQGLVFAGPKKAGKTSLLLHLLSQPGVEYVANDRVVVTAHGDGAMLRGLPTIVTVRERTARLFPELERRLARSGFHAWSTLAEAARRPRIGRPGRHAAWTLSPAQLATIMGVGRTPAGPLRALVFPRVAGGPGGLELRRLGSAEVLDRLAGVLFRSQWPTRRAEMLGKPDEAVPAEAGQRACRQLAAAIPGFECALGRDAFRGPKSAFDVLAGVVADAG